MNILKAILWAFIAFWSPQAAIKEMRK